MSPDLWFVYMMKIELTGDGSHSLRHSLLGELYHSDRGAVGESMHVFIEQGFCYIISALDLQRISIFEIGFGSGLNCWLSLEKARQMGIEVDYFAIELYPIDLITATKLNFTEDPLFLKLHTSAWNTRVYITSQFRLTKFSCNILAFDYHAMQESVDLVYYDAFSPEVQPELWSDQMVSRVSAMLVPGGAMTTYTAKGIVKQAMRNASLQVQRLTGALGKRHMLRAIKPGDRTTNEHL